MKENYIYLLRIKRRSTAAMYPSFHIHDAELFFYPTKEAAVPDTTNHSKGKLSTKKMLIRY